MPDRTNLVTGATGFCGSYVVRELLEAGERVIGTDLPGPLRDPSHLETLRSCGVDLDHPNLTLVPSDLLDAGTVRPLLDRPVQRVFHTASLYDYSAPLERLRRVNVEGTRNLLDAVLASSTVARFVHWSTCGVFGKPYTAADGARVNVPFAEDQPSPRNSPREARGPAGTHLVNAYSVSKWEQEQMVWDALRQDGLPVVVVRPAPMYGPGSSYGHGGIILAIAQGWLPAIPADSRHFVTTSVHVEDMARFGVWVGDRDECVGEDYNVVDDSIISYHEFLTYIALLCGRRMRTLPLLRMEHLRPLMVAASKAWTALERSLGVPRVRVLEVQSATYVASSYWLDNRKSKNTGFEYGYPDVREGLKDTVHWMRRVGWLTDRGRLMGRSA